MQDKIAEEILRLTKEKNSIFNRNYTRCEFDDECDECENPTNGSYAVGITYFDTAECDSYICGKCAVESIETLISREKEEFEFYDRFRIENP